MPTYIRRSLTAVMSTVIILASAAQAQQGSAPANSSVAPPIQGDQQSVAGRQQQLHRLALLAQYLNLSDDQKRQWMQIQKETMKNVRAARKDDSLSEEQMQQKIRQIHAEQKRQVLALLTPRQQEALKKWWEEQKQKQQSKALDTAADSAAPAESKDDDFFAGMVQDPDPEPQQNQAQNQDKKAPPRF